MDNSASGHHLLSEEIDQQQRRVAFRAVTTEAHGTSEEIARRVAPLADESFGATGAFVDGVRDHHAATLELPAELLQIGRLRSVTKAERELLMSMRAVACAR